MNTIHIVSIDVVENSRELKNEKPHYGEFERAYDAAFSSYERARRFALEWLRDEFRYLLSDPKTADFVEFADYGTERAVWYNGGQIGIANIAAVDFLG